MGVRHPEGEGGGGGEREAARVQAGGDAVGGRGRGVHHVQAAPAKPRRATGQGCTGFGTTAMPLQALSCLVFSLVMFSLVITMGQEQNTPETVYKVT